MGSASVTGTLQKTLVLCLLLVAATASCGGPEAIEDPLPIRTTRPAARVIALDWPGVNVTAVATRNDIVVVDTGHSPSLTTTGERGSGALL